jgi:hypothetical protein
VLAYDGDKLVMIEVAGVSRQVKAGYVYQHGEPFAPSLTRRMLHGLPRG